MDNERVIYEYKHKVELKNPERVTCIVMFDCLKTLKNELYVLSISTDFINYDNLGMIKDCIDNDLIPCLNEEYNHDVYTVEVIQLDQSVYRIESVTIYE